MDVEVLIEAITTCGIDKAVSEVVVARANAIKDEYDRIVERRSQQERKAKGKESAKAAPQENA